MVKLIATDLDGTLLRGDGTISERTYRALKATQDMQIMTVLVTARPPRTVRTIASTLVIGGLAICCNGAIMYDLDRHQITDHTPLSPQVAHELIRSVREAIPGVCFAVERGVQYGWEPEYAALSVVQEQEALEDDAFILCSEPVTKLIVRHKDIPAEDLLQRMRTLVGEIAHATHSGAPFVEVSSPGVQKASALAKLCTHYEIAPSEVVAFGDMPNDIPMLLWAGHGVAVANAHPEVLQAADEITSANEEDGVSLVIERLLQDKRVSGSMPYCCD